MRNLFVLSLAFISLSSMAAETKLSKISFYGKQAGVLFDLIVKPTSVRNFQLISDGKKIGATQKQLGQRWECTIHGKEEAYPTQSSEAQLALCTVRSETVDVTLGGLGGGSVSFEGKTGAELFDLIPGDGKTLHDDLYEVTITQKTHGQGGIDGFFCQRNVADAEPHVTTYGCHISWKK